ncbi:GspH/FimT family pseudopilin [Lysobacter niastensis]|uniref:Type II secretion system protein H n=1 Tax=Lysobacter niastensis TaxID=380629 RepID=A0ABS0B2Q7_9GAMM|nr:GspH/FimT family pseudopilin [Lysobacter niastensis]MBF6022768.1 GspH/FimT family pseudopilin [Lysobacter niastensis]
MSRTDAGFTLLEVIIALTVTAILLALAVPAWSNARAAAYRALAQSALEGTLLDANRHATVTATEVVICPVSTAERCSGSSDWSPGWMVFADLDGDRTRDANETVVRREAALAGGIRLKSTQGRTRLIIQPNGGNAGSNVTFTLCDARGAAKASTLVLSNSGQMRHGKPTEAAAQACAYGA